MPGGVRVDGKSFGSRRARCLRIRHTDRACQPHEGEPAIAEASVKTDKVDARTLAHLLRTNLIARCHVAERGVRGVRQLLRERNNLVKAMTQAINRLHNLL